MSSDSFFWQTLFLFIKTNFRIQSIFVMLLKASKKSLVTQQREKSKKRQKNGKSDQHQLCQEFQEIIEQASVSLPFEDFKQLYQRMFKQMLSKAETDNVSNRSFYLSVFKKMDQRYQGSIQIKVRVLLFDIICQINNLHQYQANMEKIIKAKYLVVNSEFEYLSCKILILEAKLNLVKKQENNAHKIYKKCLQFNEDYLVEYMQKQYEIRKEIVDHTIIAHYELFKLKKNIKPVSALDHLSKAYNAAYKNYSSEDEVTSKLYSIYSYQQNQNNNMDKVSARTGAITQMLDYEYDKNIRATAFYSWEDEKIVCQLVKTKRNERQIISESFYSIKLDYSKIKLLKDCEIDWIEITREGGMEVSEDELLKVLDLTNSNKPKLVKMKSLEKHKVQTRQNLSSQSSDIGVDFFGKDDFKFMKIGNGRSQSASRKNLTKQTEI